jgi:hypothetical protein
LCPLSPLDSFGESVVNLVIPPPLPVRTGLDSRLGIFFLLLEPVRLIILDCVVVGLSFEEGSTSDLLVPSPILEEESDGLSFGGVSDMIL